MSQVQHFSNHTHTCQTCGLFTTGLPILVLHPRSMDGLHGGMLLGAWGAGFVMFWSWETGEIVRCIDVDAKNVGIASVSPCCM